MTAADFRAIALTLEGVEEYSHAGLPAFRVGGRKFASLASHAQGYGNLILTLEQQVAAEQIHGDCGLPFRHSPKRCASRFRSSARRALLYINC